MATDIDVPFLPSAAQIRRREFASVRRGYDPDQVRDYLAQVAEQVEMLEQEVRETKLQPAPGSGARGATAPADAGVDPYERLSKRLATLLATADQEAERILEEARADAARMLDEARSDADRIRVDAQARAEEARQQGNELLERAKQEADRVLLGLSERRETLVQHLQDMQTRLVGVAKELEVAIEDPAVSSPAEPGNASPEAFANVDVPKPEVEVRAEPAEAVTPPEATASDDDAPDGLDGLENMLSEDDALDMPGIPPLELDFDDDSDD